MIERDFDLYCQYTFRMNLVQILLCMRLSMESTAIMIVKTELYDEVSSK